jgi:hypothetical protein
MNSASATLNPSCDLTCSTKLFSCSFLVTSIIASLYLKPWRAFKDGNKIGMGVSAALALLAAVSFRQSRKWDTLASEASSLVRAR